MLELDEKHTKAIRLAIKKMFDQKDVRKKNKRNKRKVERRKEKMESRKG